MQNQVNRYSQAELEEFRLLIDKKLEVAKSQLENLQSQLQDARENDGDHGTDISDDSNMSSQIEMLETMIFRQRQHIRDLENALLRIKNKSYGICVVTGELIDKKRMLAVLTTTKSVLGKTMESIPEKKDKPKPKVSLTPKTITKIIKKTNPTPVTKTQDMEDLLDDDDDDNDELYDDEDMYDEPNGNEDIDFDSLSEEDIN